MMKDEGINLSVLYLNVKIIHNNIQGDIFGKKCFAWLLQLLGGDSRIISSGNTHQRMES